jgi:hypothetical protein
VASADAPRHDTAHELSRDLPAPRPPVPPDGPVTVGSLLRREGRAAHSQDRPVVPRARDVADRGPAHRVAVTAGSILAVAAVLGTNVIGDVALGPGTADDDGERGFGGAVAPESPNPLSLTATGAPIGNAMAVLRAAGSPALAAVNDLAGGPPASGAGIVARALAGLPGSPAVAVAPTGTSTATTSDDVAGDEDGATADPSDGARSSADTSSTRPSTRSASPDADDTRSGTRRSSDRVTPTPRRGGGSDDADDRNGSTRVRIPPVLSGLVPSGPGPSGGGTVERPATPVVPAPATTPDPAPDGGGTGSTPDTKTEDDGDAGGDSPVSEAPTTDSATPDPPRTDGADGSGTDDSDRDAPATDDGSSSDDASSGEDTSDSAQSDAAKSDDSASDSPTSDSSVADSSDESDSSDDGATDPSSS